MANMVLIDKVTVGSGGAASIEFTGIPQTYTDLVIKISTRSTAASVLGYVNIRFNSDTGNNYSYKAVGGTGSITFNNNSAGGSSIFTVTDGANATANTFGNAEIYIPNYTSSNQKSVSIDGVGENNVTEAYTQLVAGLWTGTSAITSIQLSDIFGPGNFVQYSTAYLYGVTSVTSSAKASGGTITSDGAYFYHTFLSSGTFTPTQSLTADYLVVAGGGGGGSAGGGGGAGGLRCTVGSTGGGGSLETALSLSATAYTVTVGAGGAGGAGGGVNGTTGSNYVFGSITATAGGGGGGNNAVGLTGGSGGGGGRDGNSKAGGTGTTNQGFAGGTSGPNVSWGGGGGGGGAGVIGSNGISNGTSGGEAGGPGGNGITTSISGSSVLYAGGGAGANGGNTAVAIGGTGGGGNGASTSTNAVDGTTNRGAGGGGGVNAGGAGGSGIVIVRYAV
jgi:hypothetical protein